MRQKTQYSSEPSPYDIHKTGKYAVIMLRENIEQLPDEELDEGGIMQRWQADEYIIKGNMWSATLVDRVGNNPTSWLNMVKNADRAKAEIAIRAKRDKLLEATDREMSIDRLGLITPSGVSFTAWLSFLRKLGDALTGHIATYRQALRDVPQQEGFPYDVVWPTRGTEENDD